MSLVVGDKFGLCNKIGTDTVRKKQEEGQRGVFVAHLSFFNEKTSEIIRLKGKDTTDGAEHCVAICVPQGLPPGMLEKCIMVYDNTYGGDDHTEMLPQYIREFSQIYQLEKGIQYTFMLTVKRHELNETTFRIFADLDVETFSPKNFS